VAKGHTLGISLILILSFLLTACQPAATPTPAPTAEPTAAPVATKAPTAVIEQPEPTEAPLDLSGQLVDTLWLLLGYGDAGNPVVVEPGTTVTLQFAADGSVSGFGGCNSFFGSHELKGEEIKIGPMGSTMMACETGMNQESIFLSALEQAYKISFTPKGRLEIFYDADSVYERKLVLTRSQKSLLNTVWLLEEYGNPENPYTVEDGTVITAQFSEEGILSGSSGCNRYTTSFKANDGRMEIKMPASSLMACDKGMEQEAAYLQALEKAESYTIDSASLEITYGAGEGVLRFSARHLPLENVLWTLVNLNGDNTLAGLEATTALFEPGAESGKGQVGGVAMCNNYGGIFTKDKDALTVEALATTRMSCAEKVMQAESSYLEIMENAKSYQVLGETLTITSEKGMLVFAANRAPLEGTYWRLTSMGPVIDGTVPTGDADFTAEFVSVDGGISGMVIGSTGCNDYNAAYVANLKELKVNIPLKTNNPDCAPSFWEQEQQFFLGLNDAKSYRILGDTLQIPYDDGRQALNFVAFVPPVEPATEGALNILNGTRWWLVTMGPRAVLPGTQTTAEFAINADGMTGVISGSAGCNTYNAPITGVFQVGQPTSTMKLCTDIPGLMNQEGEYLAALATANSFARSNNQLLIGTRNGLLVFYNSPAPLQPIAPPDLPPVETPEVAPTPEATPEPTAVPTEEPSPTEEPTAEPTEVPLMAVIAAPIEATANKPVTFDANGSTASVKITEFVWDFGDGVKANGVIVIHEFTKPGTYVVTLTITDSNGKTVKAEHTITIK
jgi:heat shock protein HslJ